MAKKKGKKKNKKTLIIGGVVGVVALAGIGYLVMSGDGDKEKAPASGADLLPPGANLRVQNATVTTSEPQPQQSQKASVTQPAAPAAINYEVLKNTLWHDRAKRTSGGTPLYKWARGIDAQFNVTHISDPVHWKGKMNAEQNTIEWTHPTHAPKGGWFWYRQAGQ